MTEIKDTLFYIIKGINTLGTTSFLYTFIFWLVFLIIDGPLMKWVENLMKLPHQIYWSDTILLFIFIVFYIYGFYIVGIKTI